MSLDKLQAMPTPGSSKTRVSLSGVVNASESSRKNVKNKKVSAKIVMINARALPQEAPPAPLAAIPEDSVANDFGAIFEPLSADDCLRVYGIDPDDRRHWLMPELLEQEINLGLNEDVLIFRGWRLPLAMRVDSQL